MESAGVTEQLVTVGIVAARHKAMGAGTREVGGRERGAGLGAAGGGQPKPVFWQQ